MTQYSAFISQYQMKNEEEGWIFAFNPPDGNIVYKYIICHYLL